MKEICAGVALLFMVCSLAHEQRTEAEPVPEGFGISARYPGDMGIERDEDVVFVESFENFRWRKDMRLNVNKFWLLHYVSENAFKKNDEYAAKHPDFMINDTTATVWFDNIVIAKNYIGPIKN